MSYHKIAEIVQDIENEVDVFENAEYAIFDIKLFIKNLERLIKRLLYNTNEIKKICEEQKKEEDNMLNDLAKEHKGDL